MIKVSAIALKTCLLNLGRSAPWILGCCLHHSDFCGFGSICNVIDLYNYFIKKGVKNQHCSWVVKTTNNHKFLYFIVGALYFLHKKSTHFTHPRVGLNTSPLPTARPSWCHRQIKSKLPNSTPLLCVHLKRYSNKSQSVTKRDTMIKNWPKSPQNRAEMWISGKFPHL